MSFTHGTVLSVRFVVCQDRQNAPESGKNEEELDIDEGLAAATASPNASATDDDDDDDDADNNDDDVSTPEQVDWIIVTSHADNTIRFRSAKASYQTYDILQCGVTAVTFQTVTHHERVSYRLIKLRISSGCLMPNAIYM